RNGRRRPAPAPAGAARGPDPRRRGRDPDRAGPDARMTNPLRAVGGWLYDRLRLEPVVSYVREHKVPPELVGRRGWMYIFGLSTLLVFLLQVATGIALVSAYVPTPANAYDSLRHITFDTRWGAIVRGMHFY